MDNQDSTFKAGSYPDAYCFKCNSKMKTVLQETVILKNQKKAMKGICQACEGQVYRLLGKNDKREIASTSAKNPSLQTMVRAQKPDCLPQKDVRSSVQGKQTAQSRKNTNKIHGRKTKAAVKYAPSTDRPIKNNLVDIVLLSLILILTAVLFIIANTTILVR